MPNFFWTVIATTCLLLPPALQAQQPGSIRGTVLDAAGGTPIAGASVTLIARDGNGAFPRTAGSVVPANARQANTDSAGAYRFPGIGAGEYRLHVARRGYEPVSVDVLLAASADAQLSVGLDVRPVHLAVVRVNASAVSGPGSGAAPTATRDDARVGAVLDRQRQFLGADVRELTRDDVTEAVTLGNSDVLRALQRLPGVTTYDEWSARTVVRGSRWDHTRFYFDGIPVLTPMQALGTATAVNPAIISSVLLHPGVRPVSVGGDGVSRIDVQSRQPAGAGRVIGSAEIGSNLASLAGEQRIGRGGWSVAARHGIADVLSPDFALLSKGGLARSSHAELVSRADVPVGNWMLEASGITSRDAHRSTAAGGARIATGQQWETDGLRLTLRSKVGRLDATHTVMGFFSDTYLQGERPYSGLGHGAEPALFTTHSNLWHRTLSGELSMPLDSAGRRWAFGYGFSEQDGSFSGVRPYLVPGDLALTDDTRRQALAYGSVWAERRWRAGERLTVETGLRVDGYARGLAGMRAAPTVQARYSAGPATVLSAGAGRALQYTQQLPTQYGGAEVLAGSIASSGGDVPLLAADHVGAGVEHWHARGVLLSANVWARRASGVLMADPTPGELTDRPTHVTARESAAGLDLAARKLTGRITGMVAYGLTEAQSRFGGYSFASSGARRHALDATAMVRLGSWQLGGAYTAASGAPYTRVTVGELDAQGRAFITVPGVGEPNAMTMPSYSTLDLLVQRSGRLWSSHVTSYVQVQNVLDRANPMRYLPRGDCGSTGVIGGSVQCRDGDVLFAPVGRTASFGIRLGF